MPRDPLSTNKDIRKKFDQSDTAAVPIECLNSAFSPRLGGVDETHAQMLARSPDTLPPILVQRGTMRVIDGMHRIRAAQLQRQTSVRVRYLDDDDHAAFLRGVAENIEHGRPLTLADRKAAANCIMEMNPEWSDRAVAKAAGLSNKTVSAIRQANKNIAQSRQRVGRDGRVRPINSAAGRQLASELLASRPDSSLRQVAAAAGISPMTVRDVRNRMRRGEDPVLPVQHGSNAVAKPYRVPDQPAKHRTNGAAVDIASILTDLRKDPALQYSAVGRILLRWLGAHAPIDRLNEFAAALPTHRLPILARLTRHYALYWEAFADLLEQRVLSETPAPSRR